MFRKRRDSLEVLEDQAVQLDLGARHNQHPVLQEVLQDQEAPL